MRYRHISEGVKKMIRYLSRVAKVNWLVYLSRVQVVVVASSK